MTRCRVIAMVGLGVLISGMAMAQVAVKPMPQAGAGATPPSMGSATGAVSADASPGKPTLTLVQLLQKGGPVMYPLYLCSILVLGFAVERLFTLRRRKVSPPPAMGLLRAAMAQAGVALDAGMLTAQLQGAPSPLARIVMAGLRRANRPIIEVEKAMEDTAAKEVTRLQRNNRVLSAVASVAPLLGLLGTATGIIRTFMMVAQSEDALGRTELLAGGIYEALVATAVGLVIAIVALVLYFLFQERVERLVAEIDETTTELAERLAARN